jgi:PKD repeat protein
LEEDQYPPVADADGPYYAIVNQNVTFNGSGSHDPDGTIISYVWDFGDDSIGEEINPSHVYATTGTYIATLTVTDNDGLTHTAKTTINVMSENGITAINGGKQYLIDTTGGWRWHMGLYL